MKSYVRLTLILFIFIACLVSLRFIWMNNFVYETQSNIQEGELDLRTWDRDKEEIWLLDGEWDFYPSQFIMEENILSNINPAPIEVPGGWKEQLHTTFGYGSYRLKIRTDPEQVVNYSLYIPSIRSATEIYVNGRRLASAGVINTSEEGYTAKNIPQHLVFTADEEGLIDIVIQAANFKDTRNGGIARSIKFGMEPSISNEVQLSHYLQILMLVILLTHATYTLILYLTGNRDKRLLFFSLVTFCLVMTMLLSTGDKLFHQLFYISYEWDFRLANALNLLGCYALLNCTNHQELPYWRKMIPYYTMAILGTAVVTMFLSIPQILMLFPVYYFLSFFTVGVTFFAIVSAYKQHPSTNLFLVLSFVAVIHHFIWVIAWRALGIHLLYYPFDFIIAAACYLFVWFKGYFQMYEETKSLANSLKRMNEEKDQFLANTSHEFRNPLNSMLLLSKAVLNRDEKTLSLRSKEELQSVLKVGRQLRLLLTDLLEARHLQHGKPRLNKQPIVLEPIVTGVLDLLQFSLDVKHLRIVNDISKEFPPIYADENRVTQILFNLIDNAIKYTKEGSIVISANVKGQEAVISVTDTGVGIGPDTLKRLFQPYEQGHTPHGLQEGGFGLGLSITKQLIELHDGSIEVDSKEGVGTTFRFTLKLASAQESISLSREEVLTTISPKEHEEPIHSNPQTGTLPSIMVIDDTPANLLAMNSVFSEDAYRIQLVSNGYQALDELTKQEWDLVISDIMMPEISGYTLTQKIRERYSLTELPVLLLTGGTVDMETGFAAGANDYVSKPVEAVELRARADSLIALKRVAQEQLQLETSWLQAQIQPHFLFNTLNAVIALSESNVEEMRQLLNEFSHFLRSKFQFQQMDRFIPIEEELSIVQSYLYIEQVRFRDLLQVKWEIGDTADVTVPFLSIQPLVENAVQHGIRKKPGSGTVIIRCYKIQNQSQAVIEVEDNGVGMSQTKVQQVLTQSSTSHTGVGILNVEQRLRKHYGKGLTINSVVNEGTLFSFTVDR
ncbi:hybrid sensor histidine kinase/response regulator [Gracilibacillus timonensis]|uniref:hybrid sensor histidine kinase/response regulator n=1 Tax=Gracilibacillus timonensis TaxID=1816696 RepID=UPI0008253AB3|nr:ATP-binding protein [Gracilibacillus timonensis]